MIAPRACFLFLPLFLAGWMGLADRAGAAMPIPAAPPTRVYDDAHFFEPAQVAMVSQELESLARQTGIEVYVYAVAIGVDASPVSEAQAVANAWLGTKPGVVLAFGRTWHKAQLVPTPTLWEHCSTPDLALLLEETGRMLDETSGGEARVSAAAKMLAEGLLKLAMADRSGQRWSRSDITLAVEFGAAASLLALLGAGWMAWLRRREKVGRRAYYFPQFHMEQRLGAPFGGGKMAHTRR